MLDVLIWWITIQLIGLVGLPITGSIFRALPDRGYAYAKAFGLLLVGYVAWLLAMLGLAQFGRPVLIVAALGVAIAGIWLHGGVRAALERARGFFATRWQAVLASEAIFLGALLATVWMRMHDPTPFGTERPMDFAFFNAMLQSGGFPPVDPWLAGFSINYYYFGYLLMAAMAALTGLAPGVAYNLALALIVALTAQGVAGTIANLIILAHPDAQDEGPRRRWPRLAARIVFPLLGVIFVLLAGNQAGAVQVLLGDERTVALDSRQLVSAFGQALGSNDEIVLPSTVTTNEFGTIDRWQRNDKLADFNWWWPSRALWDEYGDAGGVRRYNITEFPFFSFRLGDMHPHVMALPFGVLATALALATLLRPGLPGNTRGDLGLLALSGLILGSLYTINSWDLPAYLLLYAGAITLVARRQPGPLPWLALGRTLFIVNFGAYLLFLPFHLTLQPLVGSAAPLIDVPVLGRLTSIIAPYTAGRSGLHAFIISFGLFALPILVFLYQRTLACQKEPPAEANALPLLRLLFWLPLILVPIGLIAHFPLLPLGGLAVLAMWAAMQQTHRPAASFALLVTALGCAIIFGTEIIFIRDVFGNRMNTIFKFYYQVWLLWGTLAPFALWWIIHEARGTRRVVAWTTAGLTGVLLAGALVYPALSLRDLGRGPLIGLEGRTPREQSEAGLASIRWLRQQAPPGSVVLEAAAVEDLAAQRCGGSYDVRSEGWGGVASTTGHPTVLGWVGHQQQWRGGDPVAMAELGPRCVDVDTIFRTTDTATARDLLTRYQVTHVYLGALERRLYPPESLAKFELLGEAVFQQDEVSIYQIR
ncbi:DUF2298 domain-containing protein [Candidatus Chloroploca asiatica]|uniref:DUF2298 domain-containing protein n=1 Tax=Candidatus Chloroploca asiatica TaxID=1506545 RepID=UPI001FE70E1F|nr:DUF2298 domain-containing protein [Candidatus Chloroploca asiatica]